MSVDIDPPPAPYVAIAGGGRFYVRRIFCIGKNYADHVKEMGGDPKSNPPVFFTKPADAVVASGGAVPYPPGTKDFHYEGELVVAVGAGGARLPSREEAAALIYGFAAGCDLTRRDLQAAAKKAGGPWDAAKAFDNSAPVGAIVRTGMNTLDGARLSLSVNSAVRQSAALSDMIWSVPEILVALSNLFELKAGDLVFTGTPAGVGALKSGDAVAVTIDGLPRLDFSVGEPQ